MVALTDRITPEGHTSTKIVAPPRGKLPPHIRKGIGQTQALWKANALPKRTDENVHMVVGTGDSGYAKMKGRAEDHWAGVHVIDDYMKHFGGRLHPCFATSHSPLEDAFTRASPFPEVLMSAPLRKLQVHRLSNNRYMDREQQSTCSGTSAVSTTGTRGLEGGSWTSGRGEYLSATTVISCGSNAYR